MEKNVNEQVKKRKKKRLKIGYVFAAIVILFVLIIVVKLVLPSSKSKYGNRLDGINKVPFEEKLQSKVVKKIESNDKVTEAKIKIHGKIINVIFNVKKDTSKDDAKAIANSSLEEFKDNIKKFYDIQYMITMEDEEGTKKKVTKDDGKEEEIVETVFPIMGYKNSKSDKIVW